MGAEISATAVRANTHEAVLEREGDHRAEVTRPGLHSASVVVLMGTASPIGALAILWNDGTAIVWNDGAEIDWLT